MTTEYSIVEIALFDPDYRNRMKVVAVITDPDILNMIVISDEDALVRHEVVKHLKDLQTLEYVITSDKSAFVVEAAERRIQHLVYERNSLSQRRSA